MKIATGGTARTYQSRVKLRIFCRCLLGLALLVTASANVRANEIRRSRIALPVQHGRVTAELFEATSPKRRPVIVVLHGAGGTLLDGPEMRRVAQHLAEAGNAVYVVHYFDRTGTLFARDSTMQKNFGLWLETVQDSLAAIQTMRNDRTKIGIYGYSLGAFLALQVASDNQRVAAVVEHAGGVWNSESERLRELPAVLMVHGEQDRRVPFDKYADPLVPILRKRAARVETLFFAAQGHVFAPAAMKEVREAAVQFFWRQLARD